MNMLWHSQVASIWIARIARRLPRSARNTARQAIQYQIQWRVDSLIHLSSVTTRRVHKYLDPLRLSLQISRFSGSSCSTINHTDDNIYDYRNLCVRYSCSSQGSANVDVAGMLQAVSMLCRSLLVRYFRSCLKAASSVTRTATGTIAIAETAIYVAAVHHLSAQRRK